MPGSEESTVNLTGREKKKKKKFSTWQQANRKLNRTANT